MAQKRASKKTDNKFKEHIKEGALGPVYVFTGDQVYLVDKALALLKEATVGDSEDINYLVFHGDATSGKEVADTASTYPMFSQKKLIVVKNAEKLKTGDIETLESYMESPSSASCLALVFTEGKKPKFKNKKQALYFDFSIDKNNTLSSTIAIAGSLGFELTRRGAQTLISLVGEDLKDIQNELTKLSLYSAGKKRIDEGEIMAFTKKK